MSIPLNMVCGFFGSGKTTFLKNYLQKFNSQKKIGIIQNEFSPVGIDGRELLMEGDYKVLEINNGSVFCVCLLGAFIPSLIKFIDENQPDELIMEASGMSDPIGISQILQSKALKQKVYAGFYWTIIDSSNFSRNTVLKNRLEQQVRIADLIVLNKTDIVPANEIADIHVAIKKLNPFAKVTETQYCKFNPELTEKSVNFLPNIENEATERPDLASAIIKTHQKINFNSLTKFLEQISKMAIRYKGIVQLEGKSKLIIQGVFERYEIKEIKLDISITELVIIGTFKEPKQLENLYMELCTK